MSATELDQLSDLLGKAAADGDLPRAFRDGARFLRRVLLAHKPRQA